MKKFTIIIIILIFVIGCKDKAPFVKARIGSKIYKFELALTDSQKARGLMFREKLHLDGGMLFVYGYMLQLDFYMKNTLIPLDIAFLDNNFKIVDIREMFPLDETTVSSKKRAMYALEVNRGFFKRVGLSEGDTINFITPIPHTLE